MLTGFVVRGLRFYCQRPGGQRGLGLAGLLLLAGRAAGQGLLSGQVTDSLHSPLPGVSVYLTARTGGAGLVYGLSDAQGRFRLAGPANLPDTVRLELRLLGFRPLSRLVVGAGRRTQEIGLVLREAPTRLNEVVVHGQRPGIRYNDTTTYEARQFLNGRQRTLEDLLQNVPGFAVAADGKISYKGKELAGVFVEGDNLTGADYQRITRNLDVALIEKIQPVERFVENKLLGGLVRSETTVLNITIPAGKKKPLFGSLTAELALPRYRNASANVFSYHKRSKFYLLATHNNIGLTQDPLGNALTNLAGTSLRTTVWPVSPLLSAPPLTASDFRADLSALNNETTGGFIHVFKPAQGHWKLLTDLSVYTNQLRQHREANTRYLLSDTTFLALAEADLARRRTASVRLRNNFFTPLGQKANLTYETRLSLLRATTDDALGLTTATERTTLAEILGQALREQPIAFGQNLLLTNRLSETAALQTQVLHTYDDAPQTLQVRTDLPARRAAYLGQPLAGDALRQDVRTTQQALSAETEYYQTGRRLNFAAVLGADFSGTTLTSGLRDAAVEAGPAAFANDLSVSRRQWHGRFRFDKTIGRLNIGGALGGAGLQLVAQDAQGPATRRSLYPTAQLSAGLTLGEYTTMSLRYGFDQVFSGPEKLVRQPILLDYRTFAQGLPSVLVQPEHRVSFLVNYLNSVSLTEVKGFAAAGWQGATFGQALQLDALLSRSALFVAPAARSASVQLSAAHLLDKLSTRIQIESSGNYLQSYSQVNGAGRRTNNLWAFSNRLSIGTAFAGPVNLFGGATLFSTVLATRTAGDNAPASLRNTRLQMDWQLVVRHRHLTATLRADQLFINRASYLFLGLNATYTPTKGPLTYYLTVKNLLDTRTFAQVTITTVSSSSSSYELLPRIVMPGVALRF